jgi:hypothetical protein
MHVVRSGWLWWKFLQRFDQRQQRNFQSYTNSKSRSHSIANAHASSGSHAIAFAHAVSLSNTHAFANAVSLSNTHAFAHAGHHSRSRPCISGCA